MKILVAVKRVIDPYVKIRVKSDGTGVETQNIKMSMNPFDEIAVEESLRLKDSGAVSEVIVLSVGDDSSQETLRHALALGADRALLVKTAQSFEPLNIAKIISKIVDNEKPDLVFLGKQAIDGDNNQTPQMLAALLDWPQATYASKVVLKGQSMEVVREIDGGLETIEVQLPAVISTDLRLNEPRYASLPNIMKAKRKALDIIELESLGLDLKQHREVLEVRAPGKRSSGQMLETVDALLEKLQHEAKLL